MVTATVDNHGVENSRDTNAQRATCNVQRATYACYVVKKTWQREDVIVAALKAFFCLQREPNLHFGRIVVIIRMLRTAGGGWQPCLQELREESCYEGWQHLQFTYFHFTTITVNCSANAR